MLQRTTLPTISPRLAQRSHNRVGKHQGQSIIGVVSDSPKQTTKRLLFTEVYLIDCGSVISVLPPTSEEKLNPRPTEHSLSTASGQRLRTFGHRRTSFKLFDQRCLHNMIVADVAHPILGMDFFQDGDGKRFMIDLFNRCLTSHTRNVSDRRNILFCVLGCSFGEPMSCGVSIRKADHRDSDSDYAQLGTQFPEVTEPSLGKVVTMTTPLHITTEGPPVYTPCRKLHGEKKMQVEEQLRQWEVQKVIERCDSNWASPIHAVMKPDGSWRICGDFRRLNAMTKLDRYPLPALTTFNECLAGCSVFRKIDLRQAFQQVHVDEASQNKTAIITTLGLFKFIRIPYGLKNAAQCFQRNVHQLLSDMPFAHFLHMDDLIVGSKCKEDNFRDLRCLFQRLKDKGLLLNKNKCQLGEPSLTFLGHVD